ncbi:MAG: insulinase family protein [Bacteroides sp.]|nr:insulinase family protein [Bacteroides sp.]
MLLILSCVSVQAQTKSELAERLRQGKLSNGLSYYILHDKGMPDQVSYYVYQNVGAVLEQDHQQGIAHLLEHLAFNTTRHFPEGVMAYLRSKGLHDFEAFTGKDETYYAVHGVPVHDEEVNARMLGLLHDWCHGIAITEKDVRKEQGIVVEEWRQRNDVNHRLSESIAPVIYNNSVYAHRNVIGSEESIKGFTAREVQAFYKSWYRPHMQFVAIIGDVDPVQYEEKLRATLGKLKAGTTADDKPLRLIADNETPLYIRFVDAENKSASFGIYQRFPVVNPSDKSAVLRNMICTRFFNRLAPRRFAQLRNDNQELFVAATVSLSDLVRGYRQFAWDVVPYAGQAESALLQVLALRETIVREGFTEIEFEECKRSMYQDIKSVLEAKLLGTPDNYFDAFKLNFLYGEDIVPFRVQLHETLETLVELEVEDLNTWMKSLGGDKNLAFVTYSRNGEEMNLSEQSFLHALQKGKTTRMEPMHYEPITTLVDHEIPLGQILKSQDIPELEIEEWTLSNGAKLYYKYLPEARRCYFAGSAPGGRSAVKSCDIPAYTAMRSLIMQSGVHRYSRNQLHQWLQNKDFELSISAEELSDGVGGNTTQEEAEDFFAYLHLVLANHNFSAETLAKYIERNALAAVTHNPQGMEAVQDSIQRLLYPYSEHNPEKNEAFYRSIKLADVERLFKAHLANADRYTFCLVGNIPREEAKRLVCRYIASLPTHPELKVLPPNPQALDFSRSDSRLEKTFEVDLPGDVGEVELSYVSDVELNEREQAAWTLFKGVLEQRLFSELREREQATYSVGVRADYETQLRPVANLSVHFTTDRLRAEQMKKLAERIVRQVSEGEMSVDEFKAIQVPLAVQPEEDFESEMPEELFWLGVINIYSTTGQIPPKVGTAKEESPFATLTIEEMSQIVKRILSQAKERQIIVKSLPPHLRSWEK